LETLEAAVKDDCGASGLVWAWATAVAEQLNIESKTSKILTYMEQMLIWRGKSRQV